MFNTIVCFWSQGLLHKWDKKLNRVNNPMKLITCGTDSINFIVFVAIRVDPPSQGRKIANLILTQGWERGWDVIEWGRGWDVCGFFPFHFLIL